MSLQYSVLLQQAKLKPDNLSFNEISELLSSGIALKVSRPKWKDKSGTLFMKANPYNCTKFTLCGNNGNIVFGIHEPHNEDKNATDWYVLEWHE